jgi:hypothetical protein
MMGVDGKELWHQSNGLLIQSLSGDLVNFPVSEDGETPGIRSLQLDQKVNPCKVGEVIALR